MKLQRTLSLIILTLLLSTIRISNGQEVMEPEGYRGEPYRAPVPKTLENASVLTTKEAFQLWQGRKAIFIDVLPRTPKPENLPEDALWLDKIRISIKDAYWLPNTGYQKLSQIESSYFEKALSEITMTDQSKNLVFFCLEECWMSWNAAKRALSLGYPNVYWYPDGTDGWLFEDYPSIEIKPYVLTRGG